MPISSVTVLVPTYPVRYILLKLFPKGCLHHFQPLFSRIPAVRNRLIYVNAGSYLRKAPYLYDGFTQFGLLMSTSANKKRCAWPADDALMIKYHDEEWGTPLHDDDKLFEFLVLDAFQAGLSWRTILYKRENFRKAFDGFDAQKIARYKEKKLVKLMNDAGIIRNRLKIAGTVENAKRFLEVQKEFGSFDRYIWQFVNDKTIVNKRKAGEPPVATSPESDAMSDALRKRGFKFVGSTICYAFMQAAGMINDHTVSCFRHKECNKAKGIKRKA